MIQDEVRAGLPRPLTRRQHECVELVTEGLSSKEIARKLGIAPSTVDNHIAQVMHQLGIPNRATLRTYNLASRSLADVEDDYSVDIRPNFDHDFITTRPPETPFSLAKIASLRNSILVFSGASPIVLAILTIVSALITVYMIYLYRA